MHSYFIAHVNEACAFLGDGMRKAESLEQSVHGRTRDSSDLDSRLFGVFEDMYAVKSKPAVEGAQWTGLGWGLVGVVVVLGLRLGVSALGGALCRRGDHDRTGDAQVSEGASRGVRGEQ